jgi:cytochrome c peroxidase
MPNGTAHLRGIATSPDGSLAAVTHLMARYYLPTTQLDRGWMETNALTIIDLAAGKRAGTLLLDDIDAGAANPWDVIWSADGKSIVVAHAGTHELSVIDAGALLSRMNRSARDTSDDLSFMTGLRKRVKLHGNGPRAIAMAGSRIYAGHYFSDTIEQVDLAESAPAPALFAHLSREAMSTVRRGEMLFNDATQCFQGWQSCASCHSPDARVDGLNWDLLNDGIGNPKNVKSLLLAHRTPPAMSHGVRESAEKAVRSGIRYILFTQMPEADETAIDEYLKSLQPVSSPWLVKGMLSPSASRGKRIFSDAQTGCASCHPQGLFTDLKGYDVGTRGKTDTSGHFDTPALVEGWRTAPYLHDGSAATLHDVLRLNRKDRHGRTSHLNGKQIDDLVEYLRSL